MAMFPSLMHDSLFGDLFDDPFFTGLRRVSDTPGTVVSGSMMNTDVRETDKGYAVHRLAAGEAPKTPSTSICPVSRRRISRWS